MANRNQFLGWLPHVVGRCPLAKLLASPETIEKAKPDMMCISADFKVHSATAVEPNSCILFVEDDPNDALLLQRALQRVCGSVPLQRVAHGGEALAYLQGEGKYADRTAHPRPTLLIMDLKMPVMGGI